jgi:hypothetical protein
MSDRAEGKTLFPPALFAFREKAVFLWKKEK